MNKKNLGFTFIEILVVVGIITVISVIFYGVITPNIKKGRDQERKSNIASYKLALENYATSNKNNYPLQKVSSRMSNYCTNFLSQYISDCPEDPIFERDSSHAYYYESWSQDSNNSDGSPTATRWVLWAKLEYKDKYWVSCSIGKTQEVEAQGFSVANAVCPLP